jgi:hypothetical protein
MKTNNKLYITGGCWSTYMWITVVNISVRYFKKLGYRTFTKKLNTCSFVFFSVAQQYQSGLAHLVPRFLDFTYTIRQTRQLRLLWTIDHIVAEAATYTTHSKHKRRRQNLSNQCAIFWCLYITMFTIFMYSFYTFRSRWIILSDSFKIKN